MKIDVLVPMHEPERFPNGKDVTTLEEARGLLVAARQTIHEVHKRLLDNSDNSRFRSRVNRRASSKSRLKVAAEENAHASMSKDRTNPVSLPSIGSKSRHFVTPRIKQTFSKIKVS